MEATVNNRLHFDPSCQTLATMSKVGSSGGGARRSTKGPSPASIAGSIAANERRRGTGLQTERVPNGLTRDEIIARRTSGYIVAQGKIKQASRCCGRVTDDIICCAIDPRAATHGLGRLAGNWCCWCGEHVPEGRSFCGEGCSYSYHMDVEEEDDKLRLAKKRAFRHPGEKPIHKRS